MRSLNKYSEQFKVGGEPLQNPKFGYKMAVLL